MEEDKRISLDASGYLADSELKPNPLFSELLAKKKSSTSTKSVSWVGEFYFQKGSRFYISRKRILLCDRQGLFGGGVELRGASGAHIVPEVPCTLRCYPVSYTHLTLPTNREV
eukprot:TRINITY_DN5186_c0_g1_i16.p2 TRINITY_DN5186_c0_g1~~TRINITY_DN5186_c0_g1_i16.p2  ORF type:complete len:113 (+),score=10.34 TRINITY_DN5186_c0_g1_i16:147-485(+)